MPRNQSKSEASPQLRPDAESDAGPDEADSRLSSADPSAGKDEANSNKLSSEEEEEDNEEEEEKDEGSGDDEQQSDSSSSREATPPPTLAATRERRAKAGSRMARLLNELDGDAAGGHQQLGIRRSANNDGEGDDFYDTVYGGFAETASDDDYEEESSESDQVDSDFDVGESGAAGDDDDQGEDDDADGEDSGRRKAGQRRRLVTKAYREPVRPSAAAPPPAKRGRKSAAALAAARSEAVTRSSRRSAGAAVAAGATPALAASERRLRETRAAAAASVAATTAAAGAGRRPRNQSASVSAAIAKAAPGRRKSTAAASGAAAPVRRLTQEELLAEAQLTEQINLRSLARYQRLEVEKKKARSRQPVNRGPTVRFDSYTTKQLDEDAVPIEVTEVNAATGDAVPKATLVLEPRDAPNRKCTRNFVSFTHQETLAAGLALNRRPPMRNPFCPISNQPARYFDPLTQTPYRDARSFRVLRTLYAMHHATGIRPAVLLKQYIQGELIVP